MNGKILIIEDDMSMQLALYEALKKRGYTVDRVISAEEALNSLKIVQFDLVIMDVKLPGMQGTEAIPLVKEIDPLIEVIVITAFGSKDIAMEAIRHGAYDYFTKPFSLEEMEIIIRRALEKRTLQIELHTLREKLVSREASKRIIGQSEAIKQVRALAEKIALLETTVLITGESGTGKDLVADVIHIRSKRASGPFVKINCAAIPDGLLESELFGSEKGAFTGALESRPGKFELAHKGMILLDEVGDMPLALQAKLLRIVEQKQVERLGGKKPTPVDVRIIASTNQDLPTLIDARKFREDLYYRLNVASIHIPPLRERKEDLPVLVQHLLEDLNLKLGTNFSGVSKSAMEMIFSYHWPGNVRELAHVLERAAIHSTGTVIRDGDMQKAFKKSPNATSSGGNPEAATLNETLQEVERNLIINSLRKSGGIQTEAAKMMGLNPKNLWKKIRKYQIRVEDFLRAED